MKKLLLLLLPVLLVTGCSIETQANAETEYQEQEIDSSQMYIYTDEKTCAEYIVFQGAYKGGITPRLDTDETIILNDECLSKKGYVK